MQSQHVYSGDRTALTHGGRRLEDGGGRGGHPVPDDARGRAADGAVGAVDGDGGGAAGLGPSGAGDRSAADPAALPAVFRTAEKKKKR